MALPRWHQKPEECRTLGSKPYLLLDAKLKIARDASIIHRRDPAPCGGGVDAVGQGGGRGEKACLIQHPHRAGDRRRLAVALGRDERLVEAL